MRTHATQQQAIEYAQKKLLENPVYLDTETTGLGNTDEIIEISIVSMDGDVLFDSLIKPKQAIPAASTAINHITMEMVADFPTFPQIWPVLLEILLPVPIGMYNAEFDTRMITQSMANYGEKIKQRLHAFDIMNVYSDFRATWDPRHNTMRRHRLEDAGKYLGIPIPNSHRALDDAKLTRAVFHRIAGQPY